MFYDQNDAYDQELEKTLYHEYWTDLRKNVQKKAPHTARKSQSVAKGKPIAPGNLGFGMGLSTPRG